MRSRFALGSLLLILPACASTAPVEGPAEAAVQAPASASAVAVPAAVVIDASTAEEVRDARAVRLHPRTPGVLTSEILALEQRLGSMAEADPERPQVLRQLAESCAELAAPGRQLEPAVTSAARKKAIANYRLLADGYPNSADRDEILYNLGLEYERAAELSNARKTYYELIKRLPTSKFIPRAYLAFGELFAAEAERDPAKWELAAQAFMEVMKYPPPDNGSFAYACYRAAIAHREKGAPEAAARALEKAIAATDSYPDLPAARKLGAAARHDLAELPRTELPPEEE